MHQRRLSSQFIPNKQQVRYQQERQWRIKKLYWWEGKKLEIFLWSNFTGGGGDMSPWSSPRNATEEKRAHFWLQSESNYYDAVKCLP